MHASSRCQKFLSKNAAQDKLELRFSNVLICLGPYMDKPIA